MFSEKSCKDADACRFCWMCRHVCPVGLATGNEAYTPRGRGLTVSMDARGRAYSPVDTNIFFNCCLCNACSDDCATGYDPTIFIREARSMAAAEGWGSPEVNALIEKTLEKSAFAQAPDAEFDAVRAAHPNPGEVLVLNCGYTKSLLPLLTLLDTNGIAWSMMRDEPESGANLGDLIGYLDEVKRRAQAFARGVNATGAKTVVVSDPTVMRFIRERFGEWDIALTPRAVTATAYIAELIEEGKIEKPRRAHEGLFTYHDPCRLSRGLDELEPARRIIEFSGANFREMFLHGKKTRCCGGPILWELNPAIAGDITRLRWKDVERTGAEILVTACPCCFEKFQSVRPNGKNIRDIFELLL